MHKFRTPVGMSNWIFTVADNWVLTLKLAYFHPSRAQNIELGPRLFERFCTPGFRDHLNQTVVMPSSYSHHINQAGIPVCFLKEAR
jgi:hypothetical protein